MLVIIITTATRGAYVEAVVHQHTKMSTGLQKCGAAMVKMAMVAMEPIRRHSRAISTIIIAAVKSACQPTIYVKSCLR